MESQGMEALRLQECHYAGEATSAIIVAPGVLLSLVMAPLGVGGALDRLRSIDVLRGLAALAVVFHHSGGNFWLGAIGVDIFFVISGFVMAKVSVGRSARGFLVDRAWRIYPPYLIIVGPYIIHKFVAGTIGPWMTTGSLLLWPRWFGVPANYYAVSWTLVYELAFYCAVALTLRLKSALLPISIFAVAIALRRYTANPLINFIGSPIAIEFLFGVVIARMPLSRVAGCAALSVAAAFLAMVPTVQVSDYTIAMSYGPAFARVLLWGIPSALVVYAMLTFERSIKWPSWAVSLGAASYSLYLVHPQIAFTWTLHWAAEVVLSVAGGIVAWRYLERPLLRWRRGNDLAQLPLQGASTAPTGPAGEALDQAPRTP